MSHKTNFFCRKCSLLYCLLLVLQALNAQNDFSPVDKWMQDNLQDIGGRAVLVINKDGKTIYNHSENDLSRMQKFVGKRLAKKKGINEEEALQDFDSRTKQPIASCSKWLSAALVMTFVDEGKLDIEDSIGKYLPVMTTNGKGYIKIWQCLSHLTGIKAPSLKQSIQEMKAYNSMEEAIAAIAAMPMEGEPGKTFHYSNAGLQIAVAVIEKISRKDFKTLFTERIAVPCDMHSTDYGDGKVPLPAGSGRSTAEDYIRFLTMILNRGEYNGKRILSEKSVSAMQVNRVSKDCKIAYTPAEAEGWGYGFGEWVPGNSEGSIFSKAVTSPGLFGSFPWVDNEKKYAGFLLTFGFKSKGRKERYTALKRLVEKAMEK